MPTDLHLTSENSSLGQFDFCEESLWPDGSLQRGCGGIVHSFIPRKAMNSGKTIDFSPARSHTFTKQLLDARYYGRLD
jgi:hypothetical protein